jgi:hypothetical protein
MKALRAYVLSYPGMLLLAFYATWLAGRVSLGHWSRPSLDDPKFIGAWVDVPYTITGLLLVVGLPAFGIAVLALLYVAYCDEARRKRLFLVSAISIVCMVATILVLRWDALGVVAWYMD